MKKLFSLILAVLLITGTVYAMDPGEVESHGGAVWEPYKTYQLVRVLPGNMHSGASLRDPVYHEVSAGYVMIWWTGTSGADGITVAPCSLMTFDSRVAGVLVTSTTISYDSVAGKNYTYASDDYGCDNWGYLQTYGKSYVRVSSIVSVGDALACAYYITGTATAYHPTAGLGLLNTIGAANPQQLGYLGFALEGDTATTAADDNFIRAFIRVR